MKQRHAVFFILVILGACGGCRAVSHRGKIIASKIVTKEDAERILSDTVRLETDTSTEPENSPGRVESACVYQGADHSELNAVFDDDPTVEIAKSVHQKTRASLEKLGPVQAVEGIGDEAFVTRGPASDKIYVRKDKVGFMISAMNGVNTKPSLDELKSRAKRIAEGL